MLVVTAGNFILCASWLMDYVVRAYIFDENDNIILVKMDDQAPRALPGGHVEEGESLYAALHREIKEELGCDIRIVWSKNSFYEHHLRPHPLPISIHEVSYEHRSGKQVNRLEFWFFAELVEAGTPTQKKSEIAKQMWCTPDEMLSMQWGHDIYRAIQEVYQQNSDLLEVVE